MDGINSYTLIIAGSVVIVLSYLFNIISKNTNVPSVLLLIGTGILISLFISIFNLGPFNFMPILEILGIVGLIMIVLEATLDLKLGKDKRTLIGRSFTIALLSLIFTSTLISLVLVFYLDTDFTQALLYSIPLSIISSAIVIPSISGLEENKREFMIYESTFSDILGIMVFYLLIESYHSESFGAISLNIIFNVLGTLFISFLVSYLLVLVFQNIRTQVKLFLLISVLILLYSIAKLMHFSSLLLILVFGLVLQNREIFFRGTMKKLLKEESLKEIGNNFRIITLETAFVVRTFFFVIFGITISLTSLIDIKVLVVSMLMLIIIFGIRYLIFKLLKQENTFPEIFLAPRGLITILLFYAIPKDMQNVNFDPGILLFIIIASSIAMASSLVNEKQRKNMEISFPKGSDSSKSAENGKELPGTEVNK